MSNQAHLFAAILIVLAGTALVAERTTWDGVFTERQALDGEGVYYERCSVCHGPNLEGDEDAPPLAGAQFSVIWEGQTLGELFDRTQAGMPQDAPGSLSREAYRDVLALLLLRNGFPPGAEELPSDTSGLNGIRYVTVAP